MFSSRVLPAFRASTHFFRSGYSPGTSPATRQAISSFSRIDFRFPSNPWRNAYQRVQTRQYARRNYRYQRYQQTANLFRRWAARPTFYYEVGGIGVACGGYYIYNLEDVPVSHRRRFNVIPPDWELWFGGMQYEQTLQQFGSKIMPAHTKEHHMVQRVLDRLIPHSGLENENWEIHVIDDDMKNAFVIPGGKVFVFRGILDICDGDDGLATVLGHEIAHNVAHHFAERMSQAFVLLPVGILISLAIQFDYYVIRQAVDLMFALPGSRKQEEEADYIGLLMMSESCYNPDAAVGLWARMEKASQGEPPQFLSTHPSNHNRMEKIRGWLPEAEVKREAGECGAMIAYSNDFRRQFNVSWS